MSGSLARRGHDFGRRPEGPLNHSRSAMTGDLLGDPLDEAEAAHAAHVSGELQGSIVGLSALDPELSGRLVPDIHVLHGDTAAGKSSLGPRWAAECGYPNYGGSHAR
jgi:hypothetical protein